MRQTPECLLLECSTGDASERYVPRSRAAGGQKLPRMRPTRTKFMRCLECGCREQDPMLKLSLSAFKIGGSVFVGLVAFRAFNDTLPLRALPLRMLRIVDERRILIREGRLAGLASYKPVLAHFEILSWFGSSAMQHWQRRGHGVVTFEQTRCRQECINCSHC